MNKHFSVLKQKQTHILAQTLSTEATIHFMSFSKDFTINNMKKIRLVGLKIFFSVDFNPIDTNNILDIHKYLMKKHDIKNVWVN